MADPWDQLERIISRALAGYQPQAPEAGRCGSSPGTSASATPRCAPTRCATTTPGGGWWRTRSGGVEQGRFGSVQREKVAVLAIALADGMGIPLALGDPEITGPSAVQDVLAALRELLRP